VARLPRLSIPDQLHHVLWRGNGQLLVFVDDEDRQQFKKLLIEQTRLHRISLHAWALMPDHVHLLLTPTHDATSLSVMLQALGRLYTPYYNRRHAHRGSIWEGRFRSTVLEASTWMLPAMIWLDTHPYRSKLTTVMGAHSYTSAAHYLGLQHDRALTIPPQYWALGNTPFAREAAYRTILEQGLDSACVQTLAQAALKGWALGSVAFVAELQKNVARRLQPTRPGRPSLASGV
jgi:putative transposase